MPNGSLKVTGMSYFVYHNKADIVIGNHLMTLGRLEHLDFLPSVSPITLSTWIKNEKLVEEYTFDMYVKSFSWRLWVVIFGVACITSLILTLSEEALIGHSNNVLPSL
jgi:hypothetical protein